MFTGIIQDVGLVVQAERGHLRVSSLEIASDAALGDSIAINGVDLTVTEIAAREICFDAMPETYRRSNLGDLQPGDAVNLERSLRPLDRLSGHLVRGVVEGTGRLQATRSEGAAVIATYQAPRELLPYAVIKGPICVDGASLTLIAKTTDTFSVSLVQYTQAHTNHLRRRPGERVNLETDIVARYVGELLELRAGASLGD